MNCAEFESRLNDDFDVATTASQAPELLEHTAQCASCRDVWERFRLLADGIGAWRQATPEVDLAPAVVFALKQSTAMAPPPAQIEAHSLAVSRQRPWRRARAWAVAGAAACLIVASLLAVLRPTAPFTTPVAHDP